MSTRGTLHYWNIPKGLKKYGKFGLRNEWGLHIYHETLNNWIYLAITIFGKEIIRIPYRKYKY